ncbi:MAG: Spy/CpxP family protein refolding chaperone [SAR324 cluster bacterium]|nr:Spy/CpxP family protein refolding chaperone [SAR324 cluster bacterium]
MSESKTFKTIRQSLLIAVTSATFLVGCGQPDSRSTSDIVSETSSKLDLNDSQAQEMARVVENARPEFEVLRELRAQLREEMLAQMQQDSVNVEDVNALLKAKWASVNAKLPVLAQKFTDFHTMLTPEQRSRVKERMSKGWKSNHFERLESSNTSRIVFGISIALDLDDLQEKEITNLINTLRSKSAEIKQQHKEMREEIYEQMQQDSVNVEDVEALLDVRWSEVQSKLPLLAQGFTDFHTILTQEQRTKISEKLENRWESGIHGNR